MRSVRIDDFWRGIVLKPEQGNVFLLLWVDRHNDAYAWASRHRCAINAATDAIQVVETVRIQESATVAPVVEAPVAPRLFQNLADSDLVLLGVPERLFLIVPLGAGGSQSRRGQLPADDGGQPVTTHYHPESSPPGCRPPPITSTYRSLLRAVATVGGPARLYPQCQRRTDLRPSGMGAALGQGLIAGFVGSGTRAVVSRLWPAPDPETRQLMETFYDHRPEGHAAALAAAQRALIQEGRDPYYWAGFVVGGW